MGVMLLCRGVQGTPNSNGEAAGIWIVATLHHSRTPKKKKKKTAAITFSNAGCVYPAYVLAYGQAPAGGSAG